MICTVNAGHRIAHAEPQRRDARRVHLVGDDVDAAEDDLVEGVGRERLAQQQRPSACTARSTGVNGPGFPRALMNGVRLPSTM